MDLRADLGAGPLTAPIFVVVPDLGMLPPAHALLVKALESAGWREQDVRIEPLVPARPPLGQFALHAPGDVAYGKQRLQVLVAQFRPKVLVALDEHAGPNANNFVAATLLGDAFPADASVADIRGYLWDTAFGRVLTTVHPTGVLRDWTPWRVLLDLDMKKAKREVALGAPALPERVVHVVSEPWDAVNARKALTSVKDFMAVDIENTETLELACCGFAVSDTESFVVPAHEAWQIDLIRELCESPMPKVLQNGMYDRFFLKRFAGIELRNQVFDAMLAWHALQPELAGKKTQVGNRKTSHRRTVKSLKFLVSIFTRDAFFKNYAFGTEMDRYVLNGKDCCTTLEISRKLVRQLEVA